MTAAERPARSRQRARDGLVCLQVTVDRVELIGMLEELELIDPMVEEYAREPG